MTPPSSTVPITTPPCPMCGQTSTLRVSMEGLGALGAGAPVTEAFPELSLFDQAMLLTGLHADCEEK